MLRVGIIGAGAKAAEHAEYFKLAEGCKVVSIYDPVSERATSLAKASGAQAVDDYRRVIDDADAVVVASPNWLHAEHATAVAQASRHLFCEKPMGLSLAEAKQIRSGVDETGVVCTIGFTVSFTPLVQTMFRLVSEGYVGDLASIWSRRLFFMDPASSPAWRLDPKKSGGLLFEINIHELEWMIRLGGPVRSVFAQTRAGSDASPEANDHLWVQLCFENSAVGTHEGSWASSAVNFYRGCYGNLGSAFSDEWGSALFICKNGSERALAPLEPAVDLRANFLECIRENAVSVADAEWGVYVTQVAEATLSSAAANSPIQLARFSLNTVDSDKELAPCNSLITQ